jgi:hypothetical protein
MSIDFTEQELIELYYTIESKISSLLSGGYHVSFATEVVGKDSEEEEIARWIADLRRLRGKVEAELKKHNISY